MRNERRKFDNLEVDPMLIRLYLPTALLLTVLLALMHPAFATLWN